MFQKQGLFLHRKWWLDGLMPVNHASQCPAGFLSHTHLATCLLPRPVLRDLFLPSPCTGRSVLLGGGRKGWKIQVPPAPCIRSVLMATLAGEAPWLLLHKTLEMTLGQPCCCSSSPISPRHAIVPPPLGICRTYLIRIASNSEVLKASTKAQRHASTPTPPKLLHRVSLQKRLQAPFKIRHDSWDPACPGRTDCLGESISSN